MASPIRPVPEPCSTVRRDFVMVVWEVVWEPRDLDLEDRRRMTINEASTAMLGDDQNHQVK